MDEDQNNSLKKNLDELIRLFKKVKDKSVFDDLPGVNKAFIQNFDLLVSNYDEIKEDLSEQLLNQFGTSIHKMIADIVTQLRNQLGEDSDDDKIELYANKEDKQKKQKILITPEPRSIKDEILIIDKKLKDTDLTPEQVNRLLDRRSSLSKKKH
ncbi:MAG: hypothetical protein GY834_05090 [Bacteroidetes bacterium]|nr:hypothetical protein [Bacteroidota bacterium]